MADGRGRRSVYMAGELCGFGFRISRWTLFSYRREVTFAATNCIFAINSSGFGIIFGGSEILHQGDGGVRSGHGGVRLVCPRTSIDRGQGCLA